MFEFHEISTKSDENIKINNEFKNDLTDFRNYGEYLTKIAGKAKKKSQKEDSYKRSLIRLIIGYKKIFNDEIISINEFESYNKLKKITKIDGFKEFNRKTNHFYSATLGCLLAYITQIHSKIENKVDKELNDMDFSFENDSEVIEYEEISTDTIKRKTKKLIKNTYYYPRNYKEALKSKENSNWSCEYNKSHETFINQINKKPHVEAHHLIPMAAQDLYDTSIDFASNIISLCPTCHRKIHHAVTEDKKEMIKYLFEKREETYKDKNIDIKLKVLYRMYGILK